MYNLIYCSLAEFGWIWLDLLWCNTV